MTKEGYIKLVDFGLAERLENKDQTLTHLCGSPLWMAPEIFRGEPYAFPVDVWSFAISLVELKNRRAPGSSNVPRQIYRVATKGVRENVGLHHPEACSNEFLEFLESCLKIDPKERATPHELLKHEFLDFACERKAMRKKVRDCFFANALAASNTTYGHQFV